MEKTLVKGHNVTAFFDDVYLQLDHSKIRYYRKYVETDALGLTGVYKRSLLDGRVAA